LRENRVLSPVVATAWLRENHFRLLRSWSVQHGGETPCVSDCFCTFFVTIYAARTLSVRRIQENPMRLGEVLACVFVKTGLLYGACKWVMKDAEVIPDWGRHCIATDTASHQRAFSCSPSGTGNAR
jgi:hypothetical protein